MEFKCYNLRILVILWVIIVGVMKPSSSFAPSRTVNKPHQPSTTVEKFGSPALFGSKKSPPESDNEATARETDPEDHNRRTLFSVPKTFAWVLLASSSGMMSQPTTAWAGNSKSRTDGYSVQKQDAEWKSQLSDMQYYILRRGGTESPNYSILESEKRPGVFVCAGCGTQLFDAKEKFNSKTGWPSFARGLEGVEVEQVNPVSANLIGAELRCKTCGGHLGDVFNDGYLFANTPAFLTGKRYCIDGAALAFRPDNGEPEVRGDIAKSKDELPSWLEPPKITPQ
jgi:peptide-methionine (R)-S-oxide reductase